MTGLHERKCLCGCGTVLSDNSHRRDAVFATPACGRRWRGERKAKGLSTDPHAFVRERERRVAKRGTGVSVYLQPEDVRLLQALVGGDGLVVMGYDDRHRRLLFVKLDGALDRYWRKAAA